MVDQNSNPQYALVSETSQRIALETSPACTISYQRLPKARRDKITRRKKLGRPKVHWSKRASRARRKEPRFLRRDQVKCAFEADARANQLGLKLVAFASLRWSLTKLQEENIPKRWTRFLSALSRWCKSRGFAAEFIWVHENPPRKYPAFNTHMLVNVPCRLLPHLSQFMAKHFKVLDDQAVDVRPRTAQGYTSETRLKYMLKGTDKATAMKFGLILRGGVWKGRQGVVSFKRIGFSRSLTKNK